MNQPLLCRCPHCSADYSLPPAFKQHLAGKGIRCPECQHWFVAVPGPDGAPVKLIDGKPARTPVDLTKYRIAPRPTASAVPTSPAAASPAATSPAPSSPAVAAPPVGRPSPTAAPPPRPVAPQQRPVPAPSPAPAPLTDKTTQVPVASGRPRSLQVAVRGPDANIRNVFDLRSHSFFIGGGGCHLNLPSSALPDRAIRIQASGTGFAIEGLDGFALPIGPVSVTSCRLEPGQSLGLHLEPYQVHLAPSQAVGSPIANLDEEPPSPALEPAAPAPLAAPPAAPPAPPAASPGNWPVNDLRAQIQDFALDVHGDPVSLAAESGEELEMDQTLADIGSSAGFQARRFGNPLAGLELSLVHAEGPTQGQLFRITKTPILIGRSEGDLQVQDRRVSGKHAQLDIAGPRAYTLKDLASTNGTSINDRPISIAQLEHGDVVSFGGVKFEFHAKMV